LSHPWGWQADTQPNNTQLDDTRHKSTQHNNTLPSDTEHNDTCHKGMIVIHAQGTLYAECRRDECHYTKCRGAFWFHSTGQHLRQGFVNNN